MTTLMWLILSATLVCLTAWIAYDYAWTEALNAKHDADDENLAIVAQQNLKRGIKIGWRESSEIFARFAHYDATYSDLEDLLGQVIEEEANS